MQSTKKIITYCTSAPYLLVQGSQISHIVYQVILIYFLARKSFLINIPYSRLDLHSALTRILPLRATKKIILLKTTIIK